MKAVHAKAAELGRPAPKLIAVTILTSINEEQYADLNYKTGIAEQVIALAKLAKEAGMDGVVASPQEAAAIREACGEGFLHRESARQAVMLTTRAELPRLPARLKTVPPIL